jgi:hypothetical protein
VVKSAIQSVDERGPEYGWMENIDVDSVWNAWCSLAGQRIPHD